MRLYLLPNLHRICRCKRRSLTLRGRGRPPRAASGAVAPEMTRAPPDGPGEHLAAARRRVAELERKIGQQQVDLDFFRHALRQVNEPRQPNTGRGVRGSMRSSRR
jgi:transposase